MVRIGEDEGLRGGEMLHENASTYVCPRVECVWYYFFKMLRVNIDIGLKTICCDRNGQKR